MSPDLSHARFLVVSLRYIGDVLLSTPLALSIKARYPQAKVDFVVFAGTESVLAHHPYIDRVHTVRPGLASLGTFLKLFRRYDVAISANSSDRTLIFTLGAGRRQIGFSSFLPKEWWKKKFLTDCTPYNHDRHIVALTLRQLEALQIPAVPRVVMGFSKEDEKFARTRLGENYIVLHPYSRQGYKFWPAANWVKLAQKIEAELGCKAILSRTSYPTDEAQLAVIQQAGKIGVFPEPFTLTQLAAAIRGSKGFVGVDTVGTHMAAALEVPVVALFGPTFADIWGPWPNGFPTATPYTRPGKIQRHGATVLIQPSLPCVPCGKVTCHISTRGKMECLEEMSVETVFAELKQSLAVKR